MKNSIVFYCSWGVSELDGKLYISAINYRYLKEAKKKYITVCLISKRVPYDKNHAYRIDDFVKVEFIPSIKNYVSSIVKLPAILKKIYQVTKIEKSSIYYIRSPEPYAWAFALFAKKNSFLIYHFMSNPIEAILNKTDDSKIIRYLKLFSYFPEFYLNCLAAKLNNASCNGLALKNFLKKFIGDNITVLNESALEKIEILKPREINFKKLDKKINLLFVGRVSSAKGLDYLISALVNFEEKLDKKIILNIVGNGDYLDKIKEKTIKYKLESHINFHGHIELGNDLFELYKKSDIFVFPSLSEGSPRVVLEAMSFGLPVIATDVGNTKNLLSEKRGICISPHSSEKIQNAIIEMINNEKDRYEFQKNGLIFSNKNTVHDFISNFYKIHEL